MNRNHSTAGGRFCSRTDARRCDPSLIGVDEKGQDALGEALYAHARLVLSSNADAFRSGGRCLVVEHQSGTVEFLVLSGEAYSAYSGQEVECQAFTRRRGRVGGTKDGHNIRRGIRRWLERNADILGDRSVCLRAIRDDEDILRLSAVWLTAI